jgi:hypothetical protein
MLYYINCISKTSLTLPRFIEAPHAKIEQIGDRLPTTISREQ